MEIDFCTVNYKIGDVFRLGTGVIKLVEEGGRNLRFEEIYVFRVCRVCDEKT